MQYQKQTIIKKIFVQGIKMPNLSLNPLKLTATSRAIKGYKSMSEDINILTIKYHLMKEKIIYRFS